MKISVVKLYLLNLVCTLDFAFAAKFLLMGHVININFLCLINDTAILYSKPK